MECELKSLTGWPCKAADPNVISIMAKDCQNANKIRKRQAPFLVY